MSTFDMSEHNNLPVVQMRHPSGATLMVYLFGAHIVSWVTSTGKEVLFVSKNAVFDGTTPIRGGIPLVFPQFGGGKLPSHGFARRSNWVVETSSDDTLVLRLSDNESTRALWNKKFTLFYFITLSPNSVTTAFQVQNQGDATFQFQALLHTYFHLRDIRQTTLIGLSGQRYTDKLLDGDTDQLLDKPLSFTQETDRIFINAPAQVTLTGLSLRGVKDPNKEKENSCGASFFDGSVTIDIQVEGGEFNTHDIVVWNPWIEKSKRMNDFGDEEYHNMCCIEPGFVAGWQPLAANDTWTITQTLTVTEVEEGGETKL